MVIPITGQVNFSNLQSEFGGTNPISMAEYYNLGPNVPASGTVSMSNFRGAYDTFTATINSNTTNLDLYSYLVSLGWNTFSKVQLTIASGIYIYSTSTSVPAISINSFPRNVIIINSGFIMGMGGRGGDNFGTRNGAAGGPAISLSSPGKVLTINNSPTGYIGGGGGGGAGSVFSGGGGGAGGGAGGFGSPLGTGNQAFAGGAGGGIGASGANGGGNLPGRGGGAGGSGGGYIEEKGDDRAGGGGGGGRIFPGVGGISGGAGAGAGGSANGNGSPGVYNGIFAGSGGGGGWGASGGSAADSAGIPGIGGKAINIAGGSVSVISGAERIYGVIS